MNDLKQTNTYFREKITVLCQRWLILKNISS